MIEKPLILIADDDESVLCALGVRLESMGFRVSKVAHGGEVMEMAQKQPPDLFILDIQMPGCDGFRLIEMMDEIPALDAIPVIYISGAVDQKQMNATGGRLGAIAMIRKPFELEDLISNVGLVLPIPGCAT